MPPAGRPGLGGHGTAVAAAASRASQGPAPAARLEVKNRMQSIIPKRFLRNLCIEKMGERDT